MKARRLSSIFAAAVLGAATSVLSGAAVAPDARASVSIAVTLDDLVKDATSSGVVTPLEAASVWEGGRIYTYTRVRVEQPIAGELGRSAECWVRTMGGIVGKVGQRVEGEPVFARGTSSLVFLRRRGVAWEVTARAQGQFPLVTRVAGAGLRVVRSPDVGLVLPRRGPTVLQRSEDGAVSSLHDRPLDDVAKEIASAWERLHARAEGARK